MELRRWNKEKHQAAL